MPLSREMSDDEGIEVLFNAESEQFSLANVATRFITSDVNRANSHSGPEVYLRVRSSRCSSKVSAYRSIQRYGGFARLMRSSPPAGISSLSRSMNLCEKGFRTGSCSRTYRSSSGPRNFRECGTIVGTTYLRASSLAAWSRTRQ